MYKSRFWRHAASLLLLAFPHTAAAQPLTDPPVEGMVLVEPNRYLPDR